MFCPCSTLDAQGDPNPGEGNKEYKRKLHPFEAAMLVNLFLMPGGDDPLDEARTFLCVLYVCLERVRE
jgi:hypothetical protein